MRHAVVGAGAVGGLLAAALTRAGDDVVLLMRETSLQRYPGRLTVRSTVLGDFAVDVPASAALDRDVDVLWVATKATDLLPALDSAPAGRVGAATVIPLLNGVDHVALLRGRYESVVAGAMRVASERRDGWLVEVGSPFIRVDLAGADPVAASVRRAGIDCRVCDIELDLLWQKLVFLAPLALATTAAGGPLSLVRDDPDYVEAQQEALTVASAEGAHLDLQALSALRAAAPDSMRTSMQHDVEHGRPPELDAIAGPVLRGAQRHGVAVPATARLVARVRALVAATQVRS